MRHLRHSPLSGGLELALALALAVAAALAPQSSRAQLAGTLLLGDQTVEASQDSNSAGVAEAFSYVAVAGGTATQLSIYIDSANAASQVIVGLYTNTGGSPGTLLTQATIAAPVAGAWNSAAILAAVTSGATYWIAVLAPAGTGMVAFRDKAAGGGSQTGGDQAATTLPATWSPGTNWPTGSLSAYVTSNNGTPAPTATNTATPTPAPNASTVGQWSSVMSWPMVAVHAALLPTGKVLAWRDGQTAEVWDPATLSMTAVPNSLTDLLCAGNVLLPDGRVMAIGGGGFTVHGVTTVNVFDPQTAHWSQVAPNSFATWYATGTVLADGRVLRTGGVGGCNNCNPESPEVYSPATNAWSSLIGAKTLLPMYPFMFVDPDGRLVLTGASEVTAPTQILDVSAQSWTTVDSRSIDGGSATMYRPGKVLKAGSAADSGNTGPSAKTAYTIDMTSPSPLWQPTGSMAFPRSFLNLTTLPDGTVLATGGETTQDGMNEANAVKQAERWDPATGTWTTLAAMQTPRLYHSFALLLPDGRVLVGGSGSNAGVPDEPSAEIYSPPYLFNGPRPTISAAPSSATYGSSFTVQTPNAANISSVALIRTGAVTHAFDENARYVPLTFQQGAGSLTVQAPASANLAPPGYYMLFLVNSAGVPSLASFVQLPVPGAPPSPTPTATSSPTATFTPSPTPVASSTPTASATATNTASATATSAVSASSTATSTPTKTPTATRTATPAAATATTTPVALLGDTRVEGALDSNSAGTAEAFQYTSAGGGTISTLQVYLDARNGAGKLVAGLYTHDAVAGGPGTLLAQGTVNAPVAGSWNAIGVPAVSITAATTYWIAILSPAGSGIVQFRDTATGTLSQTSSQANLTTLPATWSPGSNWNNSPASAYAQ